MESPSDSDESDEDLLEREETIDETTIESQEECNSETLDDTQSDTSPYSCALFKTCLATLLLLVLTAAAYVLLNNNNTFFSLQPNHDLTTNIPHRSKSACNCFSDVNSEKCCERVIWRSHKFGTVLLGDLFHEWRQDSAALKICTKPTPKSSNYTFPQKADYRHVMVTRNWLDAIVSGYLYHQAGYECWIDFRGKNHPHSKYWDMEAHYHNKDWDSQLTHVNEHYTVPPRNNRSLCLYLQDESEEDGMKVVMDIALSRWYKGVVGYFEKVQARRQTNHLQKSLFLCFEDLVDPFQQEALFRQILAFLFPSHNSDEFKMPLHLKASLKQQQQNHSIYSGGHASTHDPELRARLRRLVERYDGEIFNNTITRSSALFGCGVDET